LFFFAWLRSFIFTELVEVPIYARAFGCSLWVAAGASALTHPIVWFVFFSSAWQASYLTRACCSELFAFLAEAAYFHYAFHKKRALLWSAVANFASFSLGMICRCYFGLP
jgi:hypothetical protein